MVRKIFCNLSGAEEGSAAILRHASSTSDVNRKATLSLMAFFEIKETIDVSRTHSQFLGNVSDRRFLKANLFEKLFSRFNNAAFSLIIAGFGQHVDFNSNINLALFCCHRHVRHNQSF